MNTKNLPANTFVTIDVEWATRDQQICQIGMAVVRNGKIVEHPQWLIQPPGNEYDETLFRSHHIRPEMMMFYKVPASQRNNIKNGADWVTPEGETVPNERLVTPADSVRSYAYCSDTRYIDDLWQLLQGVDTLYHESTYGDDHLNQAEKYCHTTARQAAMVARQAGVGKLLLGHFSSRYENEEILLQQAKEVFENCYLTNEMEVFDV